MLVGANLITTVEQINHLTYIVTLTKEWQIKINGVQPISYWRYRFFQNDITLIESKERDGMIKIIK